MVLNILHRLHWRFNNITVKNFSVVAVKLFFPNINYLGAMRNFWTNEALSLFFYPYNNVPKAIFVKNVCAFNESLHKGRPDFDADQIHTCNWFLCFLASWEIALLAYSDLRNISNTCWHRLHVITAIICLDRLFLQGLWGHNTRRHHHDDSKVCPVLLQ